MKLNICKKFKIYTYKVKRKPVYQIFSKGTWSMNRGYFENHRYIKFGIIDMVFWTKKPKKRGRGVTGSTADCSSAGVGSNPTIHLDNDTIK